MPDPRFFSSAGPFTVSQLAKVADVEISDGQSSEKIVSDVAPLELAKPNDISFLDNPLYAEAFSKSSAGACIVHPGQGKNAPKSMTLLLSKEPYLALSLIHI